VLPALEYESLYSVQIPIDWPASFPGLPTIPFCDHLQYQKGKGKARYISDVNAYW